MYYFIVYTMYYSDAKSPTSFFLAFRVFVNGIGDTCRRIERYIQALLPWMIALGAARSAGGARDPLAATQFGLEINRLRLFGTTYLY